MRKTLARGATALIIALTLSGCLGGLLGGGKPSQMYRFGVAPSPAAEGPVAAASRSVALAPVTFADEIDTDRLLASRGAETFYIKDARWVSPASELFAAALRDAVRRHAPSVALVERDAAADAPLLQVTIMRFEAHYDGIGKDAVPTIHIEGIASLADRRGATAARRYRLAASEAAASARIGDVVAAFDAADARVVDAIAQWIATPPTGSQAAGPIGN